MQLENFKKNVAQVWKITNFDRQTAFFNGASMEAITSGFSENDPSLVSVVWSAL
jgi:hypothetical protein